MVFQQLPHCLFETMVFKKCIHIKNCYHMKSRLINLSSWIFVFLMFQTINAQEPVQQDLVGARGSSSEMALKNRGFTHVKNTKSGYDIYNYWWNEGAKSCICERINDGRVKSIVKSPAIDCGEKYAAHDNAQEHVQQDLIGVKGSSAEMALKNRGFTHIKSTKSGYNILNYWWNQGAKHCICATINDGRVKSIVRTPTVNCAKNTGSANSPQYDHKITDHANNRHYNNTNVEAAFERGYDAGRNGDDYKNIFTNGQVRYAYEEGFNRGKDARSNHSGNANYPGNYAGGYVDLSDLKGRDGNDSYAEMVNRRGFKEVHSFERSGNHRKIMHNATTGQCVEVVFHGNRINDIKPFGDCDKYLD